MKIGRFKCFVSFCLVFLILVSSFILVANKMAIATSDPVTWNPTEKGAGVALSNGNLTTTIPTSASGSVKATKGVSSGKWYWEYHIDTVGGAEIGIANATYSVATYSDNANGIWYLYANGSIYKPTGAVGYGSSFTTGDTIGVALDMDASTLMFYKNGIAQPLITGINSLVSGAIFPSVLNCNSSASEQVTANFGATAFAYSIPEGFIAYNDSAPNAPTNLSSTSGDAQVDLTWDSVTGATGYNVKRATTAGGPYTQIVAGISSTNYNDSTVTNGTAYYYVVTSTNTDGESENSNEVSATPQPTSQSSPTNLSATSGNGQVNLTWDSVAGAISYNVKRALVSNGPYTNIASDLTSVSYSDTSVTSGITYYYIVTAVNASGESGNSNEASATLVNSNNALLVITMTNGLEKEYDLSMTEIGSFIDWYNNKANGTGQAIYVINKTYNLGPYNSRKDYIVFDKIQNWEIMEY